MASLVDKRIPRWELWLTRWEALMGWAGLFFGIVFLLGWIFDIPRWLQLTPQFAPVQFNAGLAVIILACCHLLDHYRPPLWRICTILLALAPAALGLITLSEYFLETNFAIDQLFFSQRLFPGVSHPGRISPNSGIAFIALGTFFLCIHPSAKRLRLTIGVLAGIVAFSIGVMSLFGYFSGIASGYHWGEFTQMPPQLAIVFTLAGATTCARVSVNRIHLEASNSYRFVALGMAGLVLGATLSVWNALRLDERGKLYQLVKSASEEFALEMEAAIKRSLINFMSLAQLWEKSEGDWQLKEDITFLLSGRDYIKLIVAFDRAWEVKWSIFQPHISPDDQRRIIEDVKIQSGIPNRLPIQFALSAFSPEITYDPISQDLNFVMLFQGSEGIHRRVVQVVSLRDLITPLVDRFQKNGFEIQVFYRDKAVFDEGGVEATDNDQISRAVTLDGAPALRGWQIIAHGNRRVLPGKSAVPTLVLVLGAFNALLAYFVTEFTIRLHNRQKDLDAEIWRREAYERQLHAEKQRAFAANQSKSEFLANISHEIRTPLSAIIGYVELLTSNQIGVDTKSATSAILRNAQLLSSLIDDVLDLSKIESGRLVVERIDAPLVDIIEEIYTTFIFKAKNKDIDFRFEIQGQIPDRIATDPIRFRQILLNLVGNAIKFTDSGFVRVRLAASDCSRAGSGPGVMTLTVNIEDSGIGMTAEQARLLFKPFTQADSSTTRRFGGTGLGLALSKRLAQALGGQLELVRSACGAGSEFRFSLEFERPGQHGWIDNAVLEARLLEKQSRIAVPFALPNLKKARVLVVDDAADIRALMSACLEIAGAEVLVAQDGLQALEVMTQGDAFDLIFMDIQMPRMNGYEAIRELRRRGHKDIVVALTANAMKEERQRCLNHGFDDYLAKPFSSAQLAELLQKYLQVEAKPARLADAAYPEHTPSGCLSGTENLF